MVDWGRLGDGLVDGAGHLVDKGKEFAGEVVDTGTDMLGAGLDKVGAHGWADGVEDWGDETVSSLGRRSARSNSGRVRKRTS
ncbi:hypothetical protein OG348_28005 [Streptomyces sp. NBC_01243]|nr:hypothetical protein OG348_28005 [Streptomyces sp. NBC_01243]